MIVFNLIYYCSFMKIVVVTVWQFQFDVYDEYVFNALSFLRHMVYAYLSNSSSSSGDDHDRDHYETETFEALHGHAATDHTRNVRMYFSVWDLDPVDGLFHAVMEQSVEHHHQHLAHGSLVAVGDRSIHWPGNGLAPTPDDYCAFVDCSRGIVGGGKKAEQTSIQNASLKILKCFLNLRLAGVIQTE